MAPPKLNRKCTVKGCDRKHAAHGYCLMHYRRIKKHGTVCYTWGGKKVGRPCQFCDRAVVAREMCYRHYQMWLKYGDPLHSDKAKKNGEKNGRHIRKGYMMVTDVADFPKAAPSDETTEKSNTHHSQFINSHGYRQNGSSRVLEHRKIAGAKPGEIVHHIDGNKINNNLENLHVFKDNSDHTKSHKSLETIAYHFLSLGLAYFDPDSGLYRTCLSCDLSKP